MINSVVIPYSILVLGGTYFPKPEKKIHSILIETSNGDVFEFFVKKLSELL